jgi:hypothetical protein
MDCPQPPEQHNTPGTTTPSSFSFSTSSVDFNIFPTSDRSSRRRASYSSSRSDGGFPNPPNHTELTRLRSNAFWELHQSVAENGDGFVRRMRDYERVRSGQITDPGHRGRKRVFHPHSTWSTTYIPDSDESDDHNDIQILAGEFSVNPKSRLSQYGKSAISMDVPSYNIRNSDEGYYEASKHSHQIKPSASSSFSDGDGLTLPAAMSDGPLSPSLFSISSATPSSPSPPVQSQKLDIDNCSFFSLPPSFSHSISTSYVDQTPISSDKAVADLTLALASGAVGINDYNQLQSLTNFQHMDEGDPGELWR